MAKPTTTYYKNITSLVGILANSNVVKANDISVQATGYTTTVPNMNSNKIPTSYTPL